MSPANIVPFTVLTVPPGTAGVEYEAASDGCCWFTVCTTRVCLTCRFGLFLINDTKRARLVGVIGSCSGVDVVHTPVRMKPVPVKLTRGAVTFGQRKFLCGDPAGKVNAKVSAIDRSRHRALSGLAMHTEAGEMVNVSIVTLTPTVASDPKAGAPGSPGSPPQIIEPSAGTTSVVISQAKAVGWKGNRPGSGRIGAL
jgi:hypothetical protein